MSGTRALAPRMIGRQEQLAELDEQLQQVRAGAGRLVLLAGEAGAGKTRLLRAFLEQLGAQDVAALQGHCYEQDPPVPYGPFLDILGALLRAHSPRAVVDAAGPLSGELVTLLPELAPLAPAPPAAVDPQSRQRRLFDALARVLRPWSSGYCRILVLEDLHWADQTSLDLLRYLVRSSQHDPLLILGTYRTDELHRLHPLTHLLAQLTRERAYQEVRIAPLSEPELARMLEATLDRKVPTAFVAALADRTGGNPFFVEEILRALLDQARLDAVLQAAQRGGGTASLAIPLSVRDSIQRRTADLDAMTLEVLQYAAVIGRRFEFELLLRLTGLEEAALVRAVERLVGRQLVAEERGDVEDRYSFRHALSREAVYEDLLGRHRRLKHRAVLRALEELHPEDRDPVLDQLAYHSLQAREEEAAARYARLAGDRGARMLAFREALGHYQTGLDLLEAEDPRERAELLERLAEVAYPLGDAGVYDRCWREAQELYAQMGDQRKAGDISRRLGHSARDRGDMPAALAHVQAAIATLEAELPGPELAMAYCEMARYYWDTARPQETIAWDEKALRLTAAIGDARVEVDALMIMGLALRDLGEWQRAVEYLERSLALEREVDPVQGTLRAYLQLGNTLAYLGEFGRAAALYGEGMALAGRLGWEVRMGGDCAAAGGVALRELSRWEEAHEALDRGMRAAEQGHPFARIIAAPGKAVLLLRQGRLEEARRLVDEVLPEFETRGHPAELPEIYHAQALVRLALADHAGALRAVDKAVAVWRGAGSPAWGYWLLWGVIEVYCGAGREEQARVLLPDLAVLAERAASAAARAMLADAQGQVAASEGRHEEAVDAFGQAAALWREAGATYNEARSRRQRAESLLHTGDPGHREEARAELAAAEAICTALGAPLELEAIAALTARHGLGPKPVQPTTGQTNLLTRREREVVALIARGHSNRAIAEALVISERTAENHVANILGKLGLASRSQAAAYAIEHGLAARSIT